MPTQQEVMEKLSQAGTSANDLMMYFQGAKGDINQTLSDAKAGTNVAIANVNAAIPSAVNDELKQSLHLNTTTGDDITADGTSAKPFKTLKALIDSVPTGATVSIYGDIDQTIDINDDIKVINKKIVFVIQKFVLNANARILLNCSDIKFSYPIKELNQNVDYFIYHFSSSIRIPLTLLNPGLTAQALLKHAYTGADTHSPGSLFSDVYISGTVSDAVSDYYLLSPLYYSSAVILVPRSVAMGVNVTLYDPLYTALQIGTESCYLLGA